MAEPVSAFSVYEANGQKVANKKKKAPASTSSQNGRGRNKASKQTTQTQSSRAATTVNKPGPKPKKPVGAATSKGAAKKAQVAVAAVPVTTKKSSAKSNGTTTSVAKKPKVKPQTKLGKLGPANIDSLMDELFNNRKKLTKAQAARKKHLEMYLLLEVAKEEQKDKSKKRSSKVSSCDDDDDGRTDDDDDDDGRTDDDDDDDGSIDDGITDDDNDGSTDDDDEYNDGSTDDDNDDNWLDLSHDEENNKKAAAKPSKVPVKRKIVDTNTNKIIKHIKMETIDTTNEQQRDSIDSTKANASSGLGNYLQKSSIEIGRNMLSWLLNPVPTGEFFKNNWEKKSCYIKSGVADKFTRFISFKAIDQMLGTNHLEFTTNVDVTTYKNGIRETLNPEGRATPPSVWSHYADGCSIRFLNPHVYLPNLFKLNSTLQEFFHCFVGANAYLTPPNSQGFAPHFDDIEAFVLQVEGRKRWRFYGPLKPGDILARESSQNFKPYEIGKPIFDQVLEPGDVLYFPRGTIHQACTEPGFHSLHITLSVYQNQSYADLLEKLVPMVLEKAIKTKLNLRRGLPLDTFQNLGLVYTGAESKERDQLQEDIKSLISSIIMPDNSQIDAAVDQIAKKYQHEALPPVLNTEEQARSIQGSRSYADTNGMWQWDYELTLRTNVRLLRANIMRLVREEDKMKIFYHTDNDREYCKYEPNFMEIKRSEAGTIEMLIRSYPSYVGVSQFPLLNDEWKIDMATALWERGLLIMEKPFK